MTDLSIIIVNWNVANLLKACLDSILNNPPPDFTLEIIVVDSASTDGSADMLRRDYPQVKLFPQPENVGFTRGNNIGLRVSNGRFILLLNPDTEIPGDALAEMLRYMVANSCVGIIGPHTLNSDLTTQSTKRRFPTFLAAVFESTWLQSFAPGFLLDHYYANDIPNDATADVDWVQGSALMTRREVYQEIGDLDEGYIMYSEEMDWCRRAKGAGWRVVYFGQAQIVHHGGKSSDQTPARKHIDFQQSKLRYFRKHHGWMQAQILRLVLLMNYSWQLALEAFKSLIGHKRQLRQGRLRIYWQVMRSGLKVS